MFHYQLENTYKQNKITPHDVKFVFTGGTRFVIMKTSYVTSDDKVVIVTTLDFPCIMEQKQNSYTAINTLRPRQNGRHFAEDIFNCIFFNENVWIPIKISLKFVPKGQINKSPALVQIMAWRRPGNEPLSEPMTVSLPMQICVTRPQWVKECFSCNVISRVHFVLSPSQWEMTL